MGERPLAPCAAALLCIFTQSSGQQQDAVLAFARPLEVQIHSVYTLATPGAAEEHTVCRNHRRSVALIAFPGFSAVTGTKLSDAFAQLRLYTEFNQQLGSSQPDRSRKQQLHFRLFHFIHIHIFAPASAENSRVLHE